MRYSQPTGWKQYTNGLNAGKNQLLKGNLMLFLCRCAQSSLVLNPYHYKMVKHVKQNNRQNKHNDTWTKETFKKWFPHNNEEISCLIKVKHELIFIPEEKK